VEAIHVIIVLRVFFSVQRPDPLSAQVDTPCTRMIQANGV
jgi:hypothetical protein